MSRNNSQKVGKCNYCYVVLAVAGLVMLGACQKKEAVFDSDNEQAFNAYLKEYRISLSGGTDIDESAISSSILHFKGASDSIKFLREKSVAEDQDIRAACATILGLIGRDDCVSVLVSMIEDNDKYVRVKVYTALSNYRHPDSILALGKALRENGISEVGLVAALATIADGTICADIIESINLYILSAERTNLNEIRTSDQEKQALIILLDIVSDNDCKSDLIIPSDTTFESETLQWLFDDLSD